MLTLSALETFRVVDEQGAAARLVDLIVDLSAGDYPPVTKLIIVGKDGSRAALGWDEVREWSRRERCFTVSDLSRAGALEAEDLAGEVLLWRDVQDSLVIDLQGRRATRANDLWLAEEDGQLVIHGADAGVQAILRRISGGRLGRFKRGEIYDWKYVEFLRGDPQRAHKSANYQLRITSLPPGEIAQFINTIPYLHAAELVTLLPDEVAADALEASSPERQLQIFDELSEAKASRMLELISPDIAADLLGQLPLKVTQAHLDRLPPTRSRRIVELLRYPSLSVGGVMTNDIVFACADLTVAQAKRVLHDRLRGPDFVHFVYLIADEEARQLCGVISLRQIMIAPDSQLLRDLMNTQLMTLHPLESAVEASYKLINANLAALPVVGDGGQLLGVLTVDAAVSQVAPASWRAQAPRVFT